MFKLRHAYSFFSRGDRKLWDFPLGVLLRASVVGCAGIVQAASIPTHDFGSLAVKASAVSYAFSVSVSNVSAAPTWSITGPSFSLTSMTCNLAGGTANCNGLVSFAPQIPGLQTGAVYATNSAGALLTTYDFRGVGLAPELAFLPGVISTVAGTGSWGYADGPLAMATFRNPAGLAVDHAGDVYVADSVNQVIRKISASAVSTVAGNGMAGYSGDNGPATAATLNDPTGIAVDAANNLFIADQGNGLIRRVDAVSGLITSVAGGGSILLASGSSGVAAATLSLSGPQSVAVDTAGNLFVSDSFHQMIVRVDAVSGLATVYAGGGGGGGSDGLGEGGSAALAILNNPTGLTLDSAGNLYIADTGDNLIRMVNGSTGLIATVAGNGNYGYTGDFGSATSASLASPSGIQVDAAGNLYIADFGNNVIRLVAAGMIQTLAGTGTNAYTGDGGSARAGTLSNPSNLVLGSTGAIFICDYGNNVIREVSLVSPALNFGSILVGLVSPAQPVEAINIGNQALVFAGLSAGSSFRSIAGTCKASTTLAAGGTCGLSLEFVPSTASAASSSLAFVTNSLNVAGNSTSVALSGTGTAGAVPGAALSATSLSFGAVPSGTSQSQSVVLRNSGTAALNIEGISVSGSNAFTMSTTCGVSIAAGATCSVAVTFSPSTSVNYTATIAVTDALASSPQQISLSGSGTGGPAGTLSAGSLYFSSVLSTGTIVQSVSFTNSGTGTLSLNGITLTGPNATEFKVTTGCGSTVAAGQSCTLSASFLPAASGVRSASLIIVDNGAGSPHTVALSGAGPTTPLQFVPITPCRVADTRLANAPFGGPIVQGLTSRNFSIPSSACNIPSNAGAYSINVTIVPPYGVGAVTIWPNGLPQPLVSTLNSDGRVKANAAIVPAGLAGGIEIWVSNTTNVILDINGYFVAGNSSALDFYALPPCRIADTRFASGAFGPPSLPYQGTRTFPVLSSSCNIPSTAQAFALNFTVVPHGGLGFLSAWPTGQPQPIASILNASTGKVTANAAIVPAGVGGAISVYASDATDVIIDIQGYFAPAASGGLSLYNLNPCRVIDTRLTTGQFVGTLNVNVSGSTCLAPATAKTFVLNATVVPVGGLGFLTLWSGAGAAPITSTLNSDGAVASNMALVPSLAGSVAALASDPTQLILDIVGYFSP